MSSGLEVPAQGLAFHYWEPVLADSQKASQKRPIITLHGLLGSHKNFASFGKCFSAQGYPVICIDSRNHGASMQSAEFDYPLLAQDVEDLLIWLEQQNYAQQDWSRAVLLGHSMGGRVAMMHALLYPQRLAALISVDVVPSLQNPDISIARIVTAMRAAESGIAAAAKRKDAESILHDELQAKDCYSEGVLQFLLLCNLQQKAVGGYDWACNLQALEQQLQQIVCWPAAWLEQNWGRYQQSQPPQARQGIVGTPHNAELPVLLVAGGRSPYVQQQGWDLLLQYFPESEQAPTIKRVVPSAYHWPHTEDPQEFQALVTEFLEAYL